MACEYPSKLEENWVASFGYLRLRLNLNQRQVAERAGIALNVVKNLEGGRGATIHSLAASASCARSRGLARHACACRVDQSRSDAPHQGAAAPRVAHKTGSRSGSGAVGPCTPPSRSSKSASGASQWVQSLWILGLGFYAFEYQPAFLPSGIELAPLTMPLASAGSGPFVFPSLAEATFRRLPGLLADALPDDFGNALIDAWMAREGVAASQITSLDRLAYMGKRGLGALEFKPSARAESVRARNGN